MPAGMADFGGSFLERAGIVKEVEEGCCECGGSCIGAGGDEEDAVCEELCL